METSGLFKLDLKDLLHGLIVAVGSSVASVLLSWAEEVQKGGSFKLPDCKLILSYAVTGGVAYLIKKYFTPAQIITPAK